MTDTAKRLAGPSALTNSAATVYTVPSSTTTIVRSIIIANTTSSSATFFLSIGSDAAGTRLYSAGPIPANSTEEYTGFIVLTATEIIQSYSGTNSALTLTINGVEVT